MTRSVDHQLYDLFANVCKIISENDESKQAIATALDVIVRELHEERAPRRNETISEMKGVDQILADFDPGNSPAVQGLIRHFGGMLSRPELFSIAECVRNLQPTSMTPLTRMERRRKSTLLKWYDTNWTAIEPLLSRIDFD
jgi:hypothetical protein